MPLRGFTADNVVACFDETPGGGDVFNIHAPRNAPAKNPEQHLDRIVWHSNLFQYEIAAGPVDVTINHAALATKKTYYGISPGSIMNLGPTPPAISFLVYGDTRISDLLLFAHNLDYVPKFMVALDGRRVPDGFVVHADPQGGHRRITTYATASGIYLRESAISGFIDLPAISRTYRVMVFRTRTADTATPLFSGSGSAMQLGRGIIDTNRHYLRRTGPGDTPFALNLGQTIDINNGGARTISGGIVNDEPHYEGSMSAPPFVSVGVD